TRPSPRPGIAVRPQRPRPDGVGLRPRFGRRTWLADDWAPPSDDGGTDTRGSETVRWAQDCLNRIAGTALPVDGVMRPPSRSALRAFQRRQGLRPTGILGPDTRSALRRACAGSSDDGDDGREGDNGGNADRSDGSEGEFGSLADLGRSAAQALGRAAGAVGDASGGWLPGASRIIDLTAQADQRLRKGVRKPADVYALVLHQMACCFAPKDPLRRFLTLNAHFAILADGRILQLHPVSALLWASNGFNRGSVAVEFAGNFPSTRGQWWQGDKFGRNQVSAAQIEAGRYLVRYLQRTMKLRVVLAHRQSSGSRTNDPGPDIWSQVGQWAVDTLALRDGGPGFKVGTGNPIPQEWRDWARAGVSREVGGGGQAGARATPGAARAAGGCTRLGLWSGLMSLPEAIASPCARQPGVYFIHQGDKPLYVGKADDAIGRRLQHHVWCLQHLGRNVAGLRVKIKPLAGKSAAIIKAHESALIRRHGRRRYDKGGVLTNISPELEGETGFGP
uniref:peptidoglycan-binding protein n=1 Tax=Cupriavidus necator TaxID=106590 RepID=UPI00339D7FD3